MSTQDLPAGRLAPEDACLLACSRQEMRPPLVATVREGLAAGVSTFDWGHFLDQASRQRVIGLVAANLDRYGLVMTRDADSIPAIPSQHRWLLKAAYLANKARNTALMEELRVVLEGIADAGVKVVVRKGGYLTRLLYGDLGMRRLSDIDLLVEAGEPARAVGRCLEELGYEQGTASPNGRRVTPLSRRLHVHWAMNVSSLPPFVRPTSDPYVERFYVDVRTSLTDPTSGLDVPTRDLLSRAQTLRVDAQDVPVPSLEDGLIDLCLHLFREATLIYYIEAGKDLTLMKFCDVAEYLQWCADELNRDVLLETVHGYGIERPVYYALHFADLLYPGAVPRWLLDGCAPSDTEFLDEYGAQEAQPARWGADFVTRLFDRGRRWKHAGQPTMPKDPVS